MIDNVAIIFFNLLIVYTVVRAVKLDKILPWFSDKELVAPSKKGIRK